MIDTSAFQGKRAAYFTLGCKLNFSETSTFAKMLQQMGVVAAKKGEPADICLINTCSVTDVADHKCRQAIHRLVRENPGAFVVVTGCYAQLEPEKVAHIKGVDLVLGSNEKASLIQFLSDSWIARSEGKDAQSEEATPWLLTGRRRLRISKPLRRVARVATVHATFSRCRMVVTISVPTAPFPMLEALVVIRQLPLWWNKRRRR